MKSEPRIELILPKKLVGKRLMMSLEHDKTAELWRSFMPLRNSIGNKKGKDLLNVRKFPSDINFLKDFSPKTLFEKWAATEVNSFDEVPHELERLHIPGGTYAVFHVKGLPHDYNRMLDYIFKTWLPSSTYQLDNRVHFDVLGEKYKKDDPDSEEEIWIPIQSKQN